MIHHTAVISTATTGRCNDVSRIESEHAVKSGSNAQTDQLDSPLLRLPAELRNMIYVHTLGGHSWSINMSGAKPGTDNPTPHALALLRVNRQIHAEAHLFPFLYNTFEGRHVGHLRIWLESLSDVHRKAITSVKYYKHSYIVETAGGLDVSPIFWMDNPNMKEWKLEGLKRIHIDVVINKWGWDSDQEKTEKAKAKALNKLRTQMESAHPGVVVAVILKRGYS